MTARTWLRKNNYEDIAVLIDTVMSELAATGSKERRNWWDVLSGGKDGRAVVVNGHEFPVLRVAQLRQGKTVTANAIWRSEREQPPDVVVTKRWPRRRLPSKALRPRRIEPRQRRRREAS